MVRAIMHGCNGKMGRAITTLAKEDAEVEIVAGVDAYTELQMNIQCSIVSKSVM